jgi:hypothetical protein
MRPTLAVALLSAALVCSALAQGTQLTGKITPEFSKVAIPVLVSIHNIGTPSGPSRADLSKSIIDAESAATTPDEEAVVKAFKFFSLLKGIESQTEAMQSRTDSMRCGDDNQKRNAKQQAAKDNCDASVAADQAAMKAKAEKDDACYTAWKASLRNLNSALPQECSPSK